MPTRKEHPIQFCPGGNWDQMNATVNQMGTHYPGQLMNKQTLGDKDYMTVQLDSGATAATPSGVVAANDVAYFKDRSAGLVTNDPRVAEKLRDSVAGIFPFAATAGRITAIYTGRSRNVSVKVDGSTFAAGDLVIADTEANGEQGTRIAAGTAAAQGRFIGQARGAAVANVLAVDLQLPDFD